MTKEMTTLSDNVSRPKGISDDTALDVSNLLSDFRKLIRKSENPALAPLELQYINTPAPSDTTVSEGQSCSRDNGTKYKVELSKNKATITDANGNVKQLVTDSEKILSAKFVDSKGNEIGEIAHDADGKLLYRYKRAGSEKQETLELADATFSPDGRIFMRLKQPCTRVDSAGDYEFPDSGTSTISLRADASISCMDQDGRLLSMKDANGTLVRYEWDSKKFPVRITISPDVGDKYILDRETVTFKQRLGKAHAVVAPIRWINNWYNDRPTFSSDYDKYSDNTYRVSTTEGRDKPSTNAETAGIGISVEVVSVGLADTLPSQQLADAKIDGLSLKITYRGQSAESIAKDARFEYSLNPDGTVYMKYYSESNQFAPHTSWKGRKGQDLQARSTPRN